MSLNWFYNRKKDSIHLWLSAGVIFIILCLSWIGGIRWFIGLGLWSVLLGSVVTRLIQIGLRKYAALYGITSLEFEMTDFQKARHKFQPILTGISERAFFTVLIAFQTPAIAAGLFLWITVKMISGWNRYTPDSLASRVRSFNALVMNLLSLIFPVFGGLFIHGDIKLWFIP